MLSFIFGFLLVLLGVGLVVFLGRVRDPESYNNEVIGWKWNNKCFYGILVLLLFVGLNCVTFIPSNNVGVKWSAFGGTSEKTLSEGLAFKIPFLDKIYTIPTTVQERTIKEVSVQTKDAQFVKMEVNVKFQVDKANAFTVYKRYGDIDSMKQNIIGNYAQKSVETIVTEYNVIEVLGEKKNEIYSRATKDLKNKLAKEGVELTALSIKDMDAGKDIEKAISDEAVAKKSVETAEQQRLKAQKDAETKIIKAKGEAESNAILTEKLSKEILYKMWIEKWNGKMPVVSGTDGNMIDISGLLK